MRLTFVFFFLIIMTTQAWAQASLERSVLASGGGSGMASEGGLCFTLGQVLTHTTNISGTILLTQGFKQPDGLATSVDKRFSVSYNLFPNPVKDKASLTLSTEKGTSLAIEVFDLRGRKTTVPLASAQPAPGVPAKINLDLSALPDALYLLRITDLKTGKYANLKVQKENF